MANLQTWGFYEIHFGTARLRHYLTECGGDRDLAMQLYDWNTELSAAFWESFAHLEVALRNAIDRQMSARHAAKGRTGHWIFDDARELGRDRGRGSRRHAYPYADIDTAIGRVRKNGMPLDSGQVISEISFGFWHQMVSKSQMFLWPDLVGAFPYMKGRNQMLVSAKVESLRALRNRIGHHHRIWATDLPTKFSELHTLAGYMDPALGTWIKTTSRVPALLAKRPGSQ
jgi:hypothetical protein